MSFPLCHRPGALAFLDDDPDYLEMLAMVLPPQWHVNLFVRPAECIAALLQEPPFWEADAWHQQQLIEHWRAGKPLVPQILEYWSRATERFALTKVCVVDFSMPAMDGLQVLGELSDWPGSRVLLTGQADEQVAVRAFNNGLIEKFIPKQTPEISKHLVGSLKELLTRPHPRHAEIWRATLRQEQAALLRSPSIARDLAALVDRRWVEHIVIGAPFGVLGMSAKGQPGWLQLEPRAGLAALAETAQVAGASASALEDIAQGRQLANVELRQSLGLEGSVDLAPALPVGDGGQLLAAFFPVEGPQVPHASSSYASWLARQARRHVRV